MGDHDAPVSWLDRWKEQEPVRLYGWSVATAVLLGGVSTGLLTERWALAIGGVLAAILMVGGTAAARSQAWAPASVATALDSQHVASYSRGYQAALRTVEEAAAQRGRPLDEAVTTELHAQPVDVPPTAPQALTLPPRRCPFMDEAGRRCTLWQHPRTTDHRLEEAQPAE